MIRRTAAALLAAASVLLVLGACELWPMPRARFDYLSTRDYAFVVFPMTIGTETYSYDYYGAAFYGFYGEALDAGQVRDSTDPARWIPDADLEAEQSFPGSAMATGTASADGLFGATGWLVALAYREYSTPRTYYYAVAELDGSDTYEIGAWTELPQTGRIVPPPQ